MSEKSVDRNNGAALVKPVVIGLIVSLGVTMLLLLLFAVILTKYDASPFFITILSMTALSLGALAGGIVASKIFKKKGILMGAILGCALFLIVTIISTIVNFTGLTYQSLIKLGLCVLLSCVGGIIGVNTGNKRKLI